MIMQFLAEIITMNANKSCIIGIHCLFIFMDASLLVLKLFTVI